MSSTGKLASNKPFKLPAANEIVTVDANLEPGTIRYNYDSDAVLVRKRDGTDATLGEGGEGGSGTVTPTPDSIPLSDGAGKLDTGWLDTGTGAGQVVVGGDARLTNARTPTPHAASHATGQPDAISAASIGAASTTHAATHATGQPDSLSPAAIGAAAALHAANHATGQPDAISPAAIGAAAVAHTHTVANISDITSQPVFASPVAAPTDEFLGVRAGAVGTASLTDIQRVTTVDTVTDLMPDWQSMIRTRTSSFGNAYDVRAARVLDIGTVKEPAASVTYVVNDRFDVSDNAMSTRGYTDADRFDVPNQVALSRTGALFGVQRGSLTTLATNEYQSSQMRGRMAFRTYGGTAELGARVFWRGVGTMAVNEKIMVRAVLGRQFMSTAVAGSSLTGVFVAASTLNIHYAAFTRVNASGGLDIEVGYFNPTYTSLQTVPTALTGPVQHGIDMWYIDASTIGMTAFFSDVSGEYFIQMPDLTITNITPAVVDRMGFFFANGSSVPTGILDQPVHFWANSFKTNRNNNAAGRFGLIGYGL